MWPNGANWGQIWPDGQTGLNVAKFGKTGPFPYVSKKYIYFSGARDYFSLRCAIKFEGSFIGLVLF